MIILTHISTHFINTNHRCQFAADRERSNKDFNKTIIEEHKITSGINHELLNSNSTNQLLAQSW